MADPTFQIRGEPGHTHPEKRGGGGGGAGSQKKSFWPFSPQFGLKIRGGPTPPGPLPWIHHYYYCCCCCCCCCCCIHTGYDILVYAQSEWFITIAIFRSRRVWILSMLFHFAEDCSQFHGGQRTPLWMCYIALLVVVIVANCTCSSILLCCIVPLSLFFPDMSYTWLPI